MSERRTDKVKPQVLKGFRDYPPAEQIARDEMLDKLRSVVERMGYLPLQTASLESARTLLGIHYNEDSLAELFGFTGPDDVDMALRYEFTVSLARYVASNPTLPLPFRRYQYGNVWRVDKPGPGRFREFMQFDIDIVGTRNLLADAEIMAAMVSSMEALAVERFVVRYSNRKILNGLMQFAGIEGEVGQSVMRVIDKLDKQGLKAVMAELGSGRIDKSGDRIDGLGLGSSEIRTIEQFLEIASTKGTLALEKVESMLGDIEVATEGISELRDIEKFLSSMGVNPDRVEIDLTIVRGLGYYTGPVFETTLLDLPEYGSIFSGGRYDNLVDRFLNRSIPAVGSSCGVDRLLAALIELDAIRLRRSTSQVLVTVMDPDHLADYLEMVAELREASINTEIYCGDSRNLTKQIKYGDKAGIPLAVISGSDEFEKGEVTVKNLAAGTIKAQQTQNREEWLQAEQIQTTISRKELVPYLRKLIGDRARKQGE